MHRWEKERRRQGWGEEGEGGRRGWVVGNRRVGEGSSVLAKKAILVIATSLGGREARVGRGREGVGRR
jgi:hypothetical protein